MVNYFRLIISIVGCNLAGLLGSIFTSSSVNGWYTTINKPSFNPPSWIFGPVWTLLYILMGISFYLVWMQGYAKNKVVIWLFGLQLVLNAVWSILFFGMKSPMFALIDLILLWMVLLVIIIQFYPVSKWASYLLLPYIFWVSFAGILNYYILILN